MDKWMKMVVDGAKEKVEKANVFCSIVSKNYLESGQCAIELGMSIFYDKPIILIVLEGTDLPKKLIKVADKIVYCKGPDDMPKNLHEIVDEVIKENPV